MAKHDTWVELIDGHPFEAIQGLFPEGFPMRDPFPMGFSERDKEHFSLWYMDMDRLDDDQIMAIAELMAKKFKVTKGIILDDENFKSNGFLVDHKWIKSMCGEAENYQRTIELADFFEAHPDPSTEDIASFICQQDEDWIKGDRVPDPLPERYEDVDERLKHEDLEAVYQTIDFQKFLETKNYLECKKKTPAKNEGDLSLT